MSQAAGQTNEASAGVLDVAESLVRQSEELRAQVERVVGEIRSA
jgi:hypothetical protein